MCWLSCSPTQQYCIYSVLTRNSFLQHAVIPEGALRFALTARYVKPEFVPETEHWKGDFIPKPEFEYDGDEQAEYEAN